MQVAVIAASCCMVGGGGCCSCMLLLHPVLTSADAGPYFAPYICPDLCILHPNLSTSLLSTGVSIPLAHVYSGCNQLQPALVAQVLFPAAISVNTALTLEQFARCGVRVYVYTITSAKCLYHVQCQTKVLQATVNWLYPVCIYVCSALLGLISAVHSRIHAQSYI